MKIVLFYFSHFLIFDIFRLTGQMNLFKDFFYQIFILRH